MDNRETKTKEVLRKISMFVDKFLDRLIKKKKERFKLPISRIKKKYLFAS